MATRRTLPPMKKPKRIRYNPPIRPRGRPPLPPEAHHLTRVISARLPPELLERIDLFRRMEKRNRANMIEVMLERYMHCPNCQRQVRPAQPKGAKP